jgi:DNA-binding transcriptional LysR family regulator
METNISKLLPLIETFLVVSETRKFSSAAEKLGTGKSLISKRISNLEAALEVRLIYRSTRKFHLTEAGERFYRLCKSSMTGLEEAVMDAREHQKIPEGSLRITMPQSLVMSKLGDLICQFISRYPKIELQIEVTGRYLDLIDQGIDLAFRIGTQKDSQLIAVNIGKTKLVAVASPDYLKKHGEPKSPDELINHQCLTNPDTPWKSQWPFLGANGKEVSILSSLASNDGHQLLHACLEGLGIMIGPQAMFDRHIAKKQLQMVVKPWCLQPSDLVALYPAGRLLPSRGRLLLEFVKEGME